VKSRKGEDAKEKKKEESSNGKWKEDSYPKNAN
jgi:hypothetical protein